MTEKISADKYSMAEGDILIDLRDPASFSYGTIDGAVNISPDDIAALFELPKDKRIVLLCQSGELSSEIAQLLDDSGYNVADLVGGYRRWLVGFVQSGTREQLYGSDVSINQKNK